jgi:signal transduction histidine kinase
VSETYTLHGGSPALWATAHYCPYPMAAFQDAEPVLLYANPAFCQLSGENESSLKGRSAAECFPKCPGCVALIARVSASGVPEQHTEEGYTDSWSYSAWPITVPTGGRNLTMLQITETSDLYRRTTQVNEALLVTAVRQDESAEIAQASAKLMGTTIMQQEQELDRSKEELRSLALQLFQAHEDERRRIARELHDSFSQQLAFLGMQLFQLEVGLTDQSSRFALSKIHEQVNVLSAEIRALSHQLHPSALEDLGLLAALQRLLEDFESVHKRAVLLISRDVPDCIPLATATALFRIVQESLWNIVRHAGADTQVKVSLSHEPGRLVLSVNDNGAGFSYESVRGRGGLGLISMHERAGSVGGYMEVVSSPGGGTTIQVNIPWQETP